jgi:hypothetical protein
VRAVIAAAASRLIWMKGANELCRNNPSKVMSDNLESIAKATTATKQIEAH